MKRKTGAPEQFDKQKFAEELRLAKGNRTHEKFAKDSGLSKSYITKYLNSYFDKPPVPQTIEKIALQSADPLVTYETLMKAAGYGLEQSAIRTGIARSIDPPFEKVARAAIINALMQETSYEWTTARELIASGSEIKTDFAIHIIDAVIHDWLFNFKLNIDDEYMRLFLYSNCISSSNIHQKTSLVVGDRESYDKVIRDSPLSLLKYISVILIDSQSMEVQNETYLNTGLTLTDEVKRISLNRCIK